MTRHRAVRAIATTGVAALVAHAAPAITAVAPVRRQLFPALAGIGAPRHVALTFDDGPDPLGTPLFLHFLRRRDIRATFFLLGEMVTRCPRLVAEIRDAGHEIALHGYHHGWPIHGPGPAYDDLLRGRAAIVAAGGPVPCWYRPPYGVLTTATALAAARLDLRPVLWTAWGRDWSRRATPMSVVRTVIRDLCGGGTILLHDSDCTSAVGSWKTTLAALPALLDHCDRQGWTVGPLREHYQELPSPAGPSNPAGTQRRVA